MTGRAEHGHLSLQEILDRATETVRRVKEDHVARLKRTRDGADLYPTVQAFRGGESVAILTPFQVSREAALMAAHAAAVGFGADALAVSTEGWHPAPEHVRENPLTGRPWEGGDMQDAAENHGALDSGLLREVLTTIAVNRAGDSLGTLSAYRLLPVENRTPRIVGWRVEWYDALEGRVSEEERRGVQWQGLIPETLTRMMNAPALDVIGARNGLPEMAAELGLSLEQTRAHMDAAVVKALPDLGFQGAVLLTSDNPERSAVLDASFGGDRG